MRYIIAEADDGAGGSHYSLLWYKAGVSDPWAQRHLPVSTSPENLVATPPSSRRGEIWSFAVRTCWKSSHLDSDCGQPSNRITHANRPHNPSGLVADWASLTSVELHHRPAPNSPTRSAGATT